MSRDRFDDELRAAMIRETELFFAAIVREDRSMLDLLDAERSYRSTELSYRQALAAYMAGVEQLREAVGMRKLP